MKQTTLMALAGLLALSCSAHATSFDCAKAQSEVERLICKNAELSDLDERMAEVAFSLYRQSRAINSIAACDYSIRARRRNDHKTIGNGLSNALHVKRETMPIHNHAF